MKQMISFLMRLAFLSVFIIANLTNKNLVIAMLFLYEWICKLALDSNLISHVYAHSPPQCNLSTNF